MQPGVDKKPSAGGSIATEGIAMMTSQNEPFAVAETAGYQAQWFIMKGVSQNEYSR